MNLKYLSEENPDCPIFAQINISSIKTKLQFLASQISNNVDVLLVSGTKLDDSFPMAQFLLNGFSKPYRLDVAQMTVEFFFMLRMTYSYVC